MLSGESNENGEKTIIGLISKKQLSTCSTPFFFFYTFLCHCFARFLEKMSHLLISSCSLVFSLSLIFTIFSTPLRNFHVGLPKNDSLPPSLAFCRSFFFFDELRWPVTYFSLSLSFFLFIPNLWT